MRKNKQDKQMKNLWLMGIFSIVVAFNLAMSIAQFWKPMEVEHPIVCFIIWVITEAYILLFLYINIFDKKKK